MPEGDTIHRSAASLSAWIGGRVVTRASSTMPTAPLTRVVGRMVSDVSSVGKNLLITFESPDGDGSVKVPLVLLTHMRMTGSWHVYPVDARWNRPKHRARLVIECGDRIAVCFDVPVARLDALAALEQTTALARTGPDVLERPLAIAEIRRRARRSTVATIAELLLDQRVLAGVGNVYRCEALFVRRLDPRRSPARVDDAELDALVVCASELMLPNVGAPYARDTGLGRGRHWVYGRTGRPCRICRTLVRSELMGDPVRRLYWCPECQRHR